MSKIPFIIHYCWFGDNEIPQNLINYMDTWSKKMPDYKIMAWSENNFDISNSIPYVKEAYEAKKYAFVSDYVRLYALFQYGGIYLDTDVEIVKSPAELLEDASLVTGFETVNKLITAFIACDKGNEIIGQFLEEYKNLHFVREDGSFDLTPINDRFTDLICAYGLRLSNTFQYLSSEIKIYPYSFFCGYDVENSHPSVDENTYCIHHFESSWKKLDMKTRIKYKIIVPIIQKILGYEGYDKMKERLHL